MDAFKWSRFSLSLIAILLFFGCGSEKKPKEEDTDTDYSTLVLGNWSLKSASRNGQKIGSLDNTVFQFQTDGKLMSNFNMDGVSQNNDYTIKKDVITQTGTTSMTYLISEVSDTSLTLNTRFRGYRFKLELQKWEADSDSE